MMSKSRIVIKRVENAQERAECYRVRHRVFVEEQKVPVALEIDEYDEKYADHYIGFLKQEVIATARVCIIDDKAKIQRVALLKNHRGQGFGRDLMYYVLQDIRAQKFVSHIVLDAQTYAVPFYQSLGFSVEGKEFDDAGIPHIHMHQTV